MLVLLTLSLLATPTIDDARKAIDAVVGYRVHLEVDQRATPAYNTSRRETDVIGQSGKRLRVEAVSPGLEARLLLVIDGTQQLVALKGKGMSQAQRVGPQARTNPTRPFDFGYPLKNSGLANNRDLIETMRYYYSTYTFGPPKRTPQGLLFEGKRSSESLVDEYFAETPHAIEGLLKASRNPDDGMGGLVKMSLQMLGNAMRHVELSLDAKTLLPLRIVVPGPDPKRPLIDTRFTQASWNASVTEADFAWADGTPEDITDAVVAQSKEREQSHPSPADIAEARAFAIKLLDTK